MKKYTTKDFYIAVSLVAAGFRPSLERLDHKSFNFVFENEDGKVTEAVQKHWDGALFVSSTKMVQAMNELKTRIYEGV